MVLVLLLFVLVSVCWCDLSSCTGPPDRSPTHQVQRVHKRQWVSVSLRQQAHRVGASSGMMRPSTHPIGWVGGICPGASVPV